MNCNGHETAEKKAIRDFWKAIPKDALTGMPERDGIANISAVPPNQ